MRVGRYALEDEGGCPRKMDKGPLEIAGFQVLLPLVEIDLGIPQILLDIPVAIILILACDFGEFFDGMRAVC